MPPSLTVVADENIPHVRRLFESLGDVRLMNGRSIDRAAVRDADLLLVRSVTAVNEALLSGTAVRFVGSATIGTDHVDTAWLAKTGVAFAHAPGSNAESVVEYVLAALFTVADRRGVALEGKTLGVVGCGNVGGQLAGRAEALGLRVLQCDPPRAEAEGAAGFVPLEACLAESDIVSVHTPLVRDGAHPTHHLLDATTLPLLRDGAWLVNTSRGATVDNRALLDHADRLGALVLDVWENEPTPDPALVAAADLATPHIAGYSYDGKVNGTLMLYDALARHRGRALPPPPTDLLAPTPEDALILTPPTTSDRTAYLRALTRQAYPIEADDARFRRLLDLPEADRAAYFVLLRKTYPRRRAWSHFRLTEPAPAAWHDAVHQGLWVTGSSFGLFSTRNP